MIELKELRHYSRMPNSINNHSKRYYQYDGAFYLIDRETDTIPKSYRLYAICGDPREKAQKLELIKDDKNDYWGDNLSWNKAIIKAQAIIDKWIESAE
jgi:hypothetical protein